jgi:FkbM family methyltransferase
MLNRVLRTGQFMQSRLISRILGRNSVAIIADTAQGLFAIDPRDRGVGRQLLVKGTYGVQELERLRTYVPNGGRVLVVGGHIGTMAIPLARQCSELIAVEPNPASNRLLRFNLRLNEITNCTVLDVAASDHSGHIEMLLSTANSGGAKRVPVHADSAYVYDRPEVARIACAALDDVLPTTRFDLIVMDIEGSEYFALKGMPKILAGSSALAIEFLPHHLRNVSGVTVAQFLEPISTHFSRLLVPSKSLTVERAQFLPILQHLFDRNEGDDGLIFTRSNPADLATS